jgi:hypothetical protein
VACTPGTVPYIQWPVPQGLYPTFSGLYPRDRYPTPRGRYPAPRDRYPRDCTLAWLFPDMRFPCSWRGLGAVEECTNGHKGTRGLNRTVNQNPKLHFIRRLSLQTLSHHSINTPPPKFCFSSLFSIFFSDVRMLGELTWAF